MAPPSYYLVCLHANCSQKAAEFIVECLTKPKSDGGAGLVIHQENIRKHGLVLHVSAEEKKLLEIAEAIKIKKKDNNDVMRRFQASKMDEFPFAQVGPLTVADIHRCVSHAMEGVHFPSDQRQLPGHEKFHVMKRAPVISAYRENGFIDTFPLHDDENLSKLYATWSKNVFNPPVDSIRDYFGENIALYFSFMGFYTMFLIPIAVLGILQLVLDKVFQIDYLYSNILFACLNLISVTIFLELWKRRSNEHAYFWGTQGKLRHKRARPEFRGELGKNEVTGEDEMQFPIEKTLKRVVFVSLPITIFCLVIAFFLMLGSFEADVIVSNLFRDPDTGLVSSNLLVQPILYLPSIVYSVLVFVMNQKYMHLAHYLSEWENHRTQEQFEKHVVAKLILFEFVNTFLALFYIAFYLQDVPMLKQQVFTMLIVLALVNQLQESVLPILLRRPSTRRVMNRISATLDKSSTSTVCHKKLETVPCLEDEDTQVAISNINLKRIPYESTYDDFMELWLQFGHVFLFSSVYPAAALFALINNLVELKVDSYKMCRLTRKPTPRAMRDIGAWYSAFFQTSVAAIMTNLALLGMDKELQAFAPTTSQKDWIFLFVVIEHVFLYIKMAIDQIISDVPKSVKKAMDRDEFLLGKA